MAAPESGRHGGAARGAAADAIVGEPETAQLRWVVDVAAVEHDGRLERRLEAAEVRMPELVPLRHEQKPVRALGGVEGARAERHPRAPLLAALALAALGRHRVE